MINSSKQTHHNSQGKDDLSLHVKDKPKLSRIIKQASKIMTEKFCYYSDLNACLDAVHHN